MSKEPSSTASGAVLTAPAPAPELTIVVPTRNEADNVAPLVERLDRALDGVPVEILFVDDSDDHTPDTIRALADDAPDRVRLVHRAPGERAGGLGGAVVAGFAAAQAPWVLVMDGDLQHPPEAVPAVLAAIRAGDIDAVVASRYRAAGRVDGLGSLFRRMVSRASGSLARLAFPRRLRAVTDPMSGFFAIRRDRLDLAALRPRGYKILLEMVVRAQLDHIVEVPYVFEARTAGESKASLREGLRYLSHLAQLRWQAWIRPQSAAGRVTGFAAAGATGVVVNSVAMWVLGGLLAVPYLVAAFLSIQLAIAWNFVLVDRLVMPEGQHRLHRRLARFWLLNNSLVPLHLALLAGLVQVAHMHYLLANLVAIAAVFTARYAATSRWVYGPPAPAPQRVTVDSGRAAHARVGMAVGLTLLAFPAIAVTTWNDLWNGGSEVPLLIPLVAAGALLAARLRPAASEPDVHDRQVDGLIGTALLTVAVTLTVLAPGGATQRSTWLLLAAVGYLGAAATMLLGTRTAARLRWALVLPLVAMDSATRTPLEALADRVVRTGAGLLAGPLTTGLDPVVLSVRHAGAVLVLPGSAVPGVALSGGLLCLLIAGLCCFGLRRQLVGRLGLAALAMTTVAVLVVVAALLTGRLFGAGALRVAAVPAIGDVLLAGTVAVLVWRWSRATAELEPASRHYVPPWRLVTVILIGVAALLGVATWAALSPAAPHLPAIVGAGR
jgi:putative flippase GtrA